MAVAQGVVKKLVTDAVTEVAPQGLVFDPAAYSGNWRVIEVGVGYTDKKLHDDLVQWHRMRRDFDPGIS